MASSSSTTGRQSEIEITHAFEEIAPPSASASASTCATSSTPLQKLQWDVFINHRGPDVKQTLARAMYHALHATGLRVFLDSEELQLGDFLPAALEQAMRSASLHVAIFSPTYAESPWCLAELSFMLKSGATIIPVFYHVQPTDLRWVAQGKGLYVKAFLEHQEKGRYSMEKLEEWKMALHNVSFCKGEIINNNGEEQMTLKTIVSHVLKVMQIVPLEVAKHPVGLQEAVADFEMIAYEYAEIQPDVQIVGIWGMGGSGKTTLAKELYNQKHLYVQRSSFVFDIRDAAAKHELYKKQIELLQDLGFKGENFDNIEKGKGILSNHLKSVRVLIILDDVDHIDQLDALLPTKDSLGSGSLIIVTTREKEVLRCWGISNIYEMKAMNHCHAKQMFCWHAFLQPFPLLGFEELVEKFLSVCNGLPLSLKVLGGQLYDESRKDHWNTLLNEISKILPHDITKKLRLSYDALGEEEKQIFLDVACFFIGKDISTAIAVWEGSGWNGMYRWERLVNKCLVDLNDHNRIRMHDHLKDLGREIANTQSPYRLWSPDQITSIQKRLEERVQIRGLILNTETNDGHKFPSFLVNTSKGFSGFCWCSGRSPFRLAKEVFFVGENYLDRGICNLSGELTWLSCDEIYQKHLPSRLPLKNLRVLKLTSSAKLKELWKDGADAPVQLRELVFGGCAQFRRFPKSIGLLRHLKKIHLSDCDNLRSLPEEFCLLRSLEHLTLQLCPRLSLLPSSFGNLTNLQHLELWSCFRLRMLPISFKHLRLLQHMHIFSCPELTLQSDILEYITKLEFLSFESIPLKELPRHITNQASLRELFIAATDIRELPLNIGQLSKLRVMYINISSCKMQSLPESMGRLDLLERLELNLAVECLPQSFTQLINLHFLSIVNCPIIELPFWGQSFSSSFCKLEKIYLGGTRVSKILISEECCPGLLTLTLNGNDHLREIHTLPSALKFIEVNNCIILRNMKGMSGLSNLQTLEIKDCPEVDAFPSLAESTSLQIIVITGCGRVEKMEGLKHCRSLNTLMIGNCSGLNALPSFAELTALQIIAITGCGRVEKIEGLKHCKSLNTLKIDNCSGLNALPSLANLTSLRKIKLKDCHKLSKIGSLQHCRSLEALRISGCPELDELPSFADLISLNVFELKGRNKVEKIEGLQQCSSLETVLADTCWEVPGIESLEHMQRLRTLQLVAKKRSAVEPFIQTIQKWPEEVIIFTRAVPDAGLLLQSLAFRNLCVVDSIANKKNYYPSNPYFFLKLRQKRSSNANANMVCLVINCVCSPSMKWVMERMPGDRLIPHIIYTDVDAGKWVFIGVTKQKYHGWLIQGNDNSLVEKGFLVTGDENSLVEAFHRLLALLGN